MHVFPLTVTTLCPQYWYCCNVWFLGSPKHRMYFSRGLFIHYRYLNSGWGGELNISPFPPSQEKHKKVKPSNQKWCHGPEETHTETSDFCPFCFSMEEFGDNSCSRTFFFFFLNGGLCKENTAGINVHLSERPPVDTVTCGRDQHLLNLPPGDLRRDREVINRELRAVASGL